MNKFKIYNLLFEEESVTKKDSPEEQVMTPGNDIKARPSLGSVDDQIDALILRYEKSSIRDESKETLEEALKTLRLKILLEQPEDELPPPPNPVEEEPEAEEPEDTNSEPEGSEKMTVDEPADNQNIPDLDIDAFTNRVVRLIMNHKNLLRVEDAIINRVKNFLDENYGDMYVTKYLEILSQQYGLEAEAFDVDYLEDEKFAVGAYAGGTGGLGGGG